MYVHVQILPSLISIADVLHLHSAWISHSYSPGYVDYIQCQAKHGTVSCLSDTGKNILCFKLLSFSFRSLRKFSPRAELNKF